MGKQQRGRAPEADQAQGVAEPEQQSAGVGDPPAQAAAPEADQAQGVAEAAPAGMVRCRALATCLVRGMPEYDGAEFWLDIDQAARLESKGSLELV